MNSKNKIELIPKDVSSLSLYKKERLNEILIKLKENKLIYGVMLGGSVSYRNDIEKSDIDLFCLVQEVNQFVKNINEYFDDLNELNVIINQGYFPWTEKLFTFYYKKDLDFSIDICLVDIKNVRTFFWEPNGYILLDKNELIYSSRESQMSNPHYTKQPFLKQNPFSLAVVTLKKIRKNLLREHLWNALEQLNILRRYIIQIIRLNDLKDKNFLGRVDRDIEEVVPDEINKKLIQTVALYDKSDIATKAIALSITLKSLMDHIDEYKEGYVKKWVINQTEYEIKELKQIIT